MKKIFFLSALLTLFFFSPPAFADASLPLDLAYTMKTLGKEDRPVLSPDGKWIVYGVFTPPEKSPGGEIEPRFLPGGTPSINIGSSLFLAATDAPQPKSICPEKGSCWRPSWSPDSSRIVFYSDADGVPQLWMYDFKTQKVKKVSDAKIKAKLWEGDEAFWSPEGATVYVPLAPASGSHASNPAETPKTESKPPADDIETYFAGKEVHDPEKQEPTQNYTEFFNQENNATLASIDLASGAVKQLVPAGGEPRPSCLTLSPSGKWIAYLSVYRIPDLTSAKAFYDLAIIPAAGGKVRVIAKDLEVNDNDYYTLAYRWHPSRDELVYFKNQKLWYVNLNDANLRSRPIATELGDIAPFPIAFLNGGSGLLVGTNPVDRKDYSGFWPTGLAVVPIEAGGKPVKIAIDSKLEFDQALTARPNVVWQPKNSQIVSLWRDSVSGERVFLTSNAETGSSEVLKKEIGRFRFLGSATGQKEIFGTYEDAATPGDVYRFDANLSSRKQISHVEPRFENIRLGQIEFFETQIAQYDGKLIRVRTAVIVPPGAKKGDKLPTVVFHYGGLSLAKNADRFLAGSPASVPISVFVTRGYAALLTYLIIGPEATGGNPVQDMTETLVPQIYRAAELGYTDINRVALLGQSYGGYSTAAIITKTNLFRAAIAISGLYDLPGLYSWMIKGITPHMNWSESGQGRMGTHPWGNLARYVENSPYYQADKIQTPLLMIHGGSDDTCPVQDAEKMFVALKRLGKTAQLAVYKEEGHTVDTWSLPKAIDATQRMLDFLSRYLR